MFAYLAAARRSRAVHRQRGADHAERGRRVCRFVRVLVSGSSEVGEVGDAQEACDEEEGASQEVVRVWSRDG